LEKPTYEELCISSSQDQDTQGQDTQGQYTQGQDTQGQDPQGQDTQIQGHDKKYFITSISLYF